jgi:acyl-CoA thioesterase FadM
VFKQDVWRAGGKAPLVQGVVHMVCVDADKQLVRLPEVVTRVAPSR